MQIAYVWREILTHTLMRTVFSFVGLPSNSHVSLWFLPSVHCCRFLHFKSHDTFDAKTMINNSHYNIRVVTSCQVSEAPAEIRRPPSEEHGVTESPEMVWRQTHRPRVLCCRQKWYEHSEHLGRFLTERVEWRSGCGTRWISPIFDWLFFTLTSSHRTACFLVLIAMI